MATSTGRKRWAIAEGYIPLWSSGPAPELVSHEAFCLLNAGDQEAHIEVTIFYSDRDSVGPYKLTVPTRRAHHFRFNNLSDPEPIPQGTDYLSAIESDVPVAGSRAAYAPRLATGRERSSAR